MKKGITVAIVIILAVGLGYYLFKISPQVQPGEQAVQFDLTGIGTQTEPSAVKTDDHFLGSAEAKNTMIIYEDLQCPACKAYKPIADQIPQQLTDTKLIFRHFPLLNNHKNAAMASLAAEAASAQGKFWEFSNIAYDKQGEWSDLSDPSDKFAEYAQAAGVADLNRFKNDLKEQKYKDRVQRDLREGTALQLPGTPTLYFNGKMIDLGSLEKLKQEAEPLYVK